MTSAGKLTLRCTAWTPISKGALIGKADIYVQNLRVTFRGVLVLENGGRRWASLPALPMLDRSGVALRDGDGKIKYATIITFDTREVRDAFSNAVLEAVRAHSPHIFNAEEAVS